MQIFAKSILYIFNSSFIHIYFSHSRIFETFLDIDLEKIYTVILSLPLIQEGWRKYLHLVPVNGLQQNLRLSARKTGLSHPVIYY